jgi:hypothetical protein
MLAAWALELQRQIRPFWPALRVITAGLGGSPYNPDRISRICPGVLYVKPPGWRLFLELL